MKKVLLTLSAIFAIATAKAQYVSISDTAFLSFLTANYPSAISGSLLDTTHSDIVNTAALDCSGLGINNLNGIQFFDNLESLTCWGNNLTTLPTLPKTLIRLSCQNNKLTSLPALPGTLETLICGSNSLTSLPSLPSSLQILRLSTNTITSLPALPSALNILECYNNGLTSLPVLPSKMRILNCEFNSLASLPTLPDSLRELHCRLNSIIGLPTLPGKLGYLDCRSNSLAGLPTLSDSLEYLACSYNSITTLPTLPDALITLTCSYNSLSSLPTLPRSLQQLNCDNNNINSLPTMPVALQSLDCSNNILTSLPALPEDLFAVNCSYNRLASISNIPKSLKDFQCIYNPSLYCLPTFSQDDFYAFSVKTNTGISCLPKFIVAGYSMDGSATLPICLPSSGCAIAYNIVGNIHEDTSVNCALDSINNGISLTHIKLKKYTNGVLDHQMFSFDDGYYGFDADITDSIDIVVDTAGLPFTVSCPVLSRRSAKISLSDSLFYDQDFGIKCKDIDLGIQSIYGTFRKGFTRPLYIKGGDLSKGYNLNCGKGIGGTVTTTISGAASYVAPFPGALTPTSISGSTITYSVSDFGTIDIDSAFNVMIAVDSSAILGSSICISTVVSTSSIDVNWGNDSLVYCGMVVNSFDPNDKLVYPASSVAAGEWLTYTINFQNTGTDTAYHIIVRDTLDHNLDIGSFTFLASSHHPQIGIDGSAVLFNFTHINLLDSFHNEPKSHGWVQYKIKSSTSLPPLTVIKNKASIYFDDNAPIVTNTTSNINSPLYISSNNQLVGFELNPNPAASFITVISTEAGEFKLFNLMGSQVCGATIVKPNSPIQINLPQLANGVYIYQFSSVNGAKKSGKLFIQSK